MVFLSVSKTTRTIKHLQQNSGRNSTTFYNIVLYPARFIKYQEILKGISSFTAENALKLADITKIYYNLYVINQNLPIYSLILAFYLLLMHFQSIHIVFAAFRRICNRFLSLTRPRFLPLQVWHKTPATLFCIPPSAFRWAALPCGKGSILHSHCPLQSNSY